MLASRLPARDRRNALCQGLLLSVARLVFVGFVVGGLVGFPANVWALDTTDSAQDDADGPKENRHAKFEFDLVGFSIGGTSLSLPGGSLFFGGRFLSFGWMRWKWTLAEWAVGVSHNFGNESSSSLIMVRAGTSLSLRFAESHGALRHLLVGYVAKTNYGYTTNFIMGTDCEEWNRIRGYTVGLGYEMEKRFFRDEEAYLSLRLSVGYVSLTERDLEPGVHDPCYPVLPKTQAIVPEITFSIGL